MIRLRLPTVVIPMYMLSIWTLGHTKGCGDRQHEINGRCCDMCHPGTYLEDFCSEGQKTVCKPCKEGYFSAQDNNFDRCKKCQSCHQEYDQKCTLTSNAICACRAGFLCSNNICSICEENKCITGEKVKRTAVNSSVVGLVQYSYQCEPLCPQNAYFDANKDICKPWTQCSAAGLAERFPGNKTHNSICEIPELHRDDRVHVILGIGFVLLSLTILLFLCYTCVKKLRKHTENNDPIHAVSTDTYDVHLSKEESGLNLIILNESKDSSF
ncbi:tumor necrosis factor receptor superfamily member 18 isoform X3 [Embiotoca jacksoni]|uniref:tumor necrosis factor receptor superfamily member 18 isoform X3 n=1 Tax=Embiotoca jacksoni TaxID=100190 RepID=UPI003703A51C